MGTINDFENGWSKKIQERQSMNGLDLQILLFQLLCILFIIMEQVTLVRQVYSQFDVLNEDLEEIIQILLLQLQ